MTAPTAARRRVPIRVLVLAPLVLFVAVFVLARVAFGGSSQGVNPFRDRPPLAAEDTAASAAASTATGDDQQLLERLAAVPQGVWLTPESYPLDQVGAVVARVSGEGERAGRTPVFVVYGITDRDCSGGESSGGLPPDQYVQWVDRIAAAISARAVAIVEPDALATAAECGQGQQRSDLLRRAVDVLVRSDATVYLDAGHANWTDPSAMASMLVEAGVGQARGFSTNVSGYESESAERAYAEAISAMLDGAHYVIDTGRNGAGSNGQWCNPDGRALGREPQASDEGALDAYLWVKPPGESDGTCGGGPVAGAFWVERALALARAAGW